MTPFRLQTANQLDLQSAGNRLDTDGVKLFCTTMGKNVADRAMQVQSGTLVQHRPELGVLEILQLYLVQVLGGYGYIGDYVVERLWRDAKLLEIGGGTLESHQKNMTREMASFQRMP